jgi:tetratricopeptide (TPR) repeat protein
MGTHWARQQIKNKELEGMLAKSILWIKANQKIASSLAGAILLILVVVLAAFYNSRSAQEAAWANLSSAEGLAASGHKNQALSQIKTLEKKYPNAPAEGFGLLFAGDIAYSTGDYVAAQSYYAKVANTNSPFLTPLSLNDLTLSYEASGQFAKSIDEAQKFLNLYPDHFLAPQVHSAMARSLDAEGKTEDAKIAYQKISLEYPNTYFAAWAQGHLSPVSTAKLDKKVKKNALNRNSMPVFQKRPRKD